MKKIFIIIFLLASTLTFAQNNFIREKYDKDKKGWKNNLSDMVFVEGSYFRNLGNFGQIFNKASGFYINYGKHFNNSYQLIVKTGYTSFHNRDETQSDSNSLSAIPLQVGGRYYVLPNRIMPYFSFLGGINIISRDKGVTGVTDDKTLFRFMWQAGFGIAFKVIKEVNIDICAKYNNNFYDPTAMMTSLEYSGGISVNLSKSLVNF